MLIIFFSYAYPINFFIPSLAWFLLNLFDLNYLIFFLFNIFSILNFCLLYLISSCNAYKAKHVLIYNKPPSVYKATKFTCGFTMSCCSRQCTCSKAHCPHNLALSHILLFYLLLLLYFSWKNFKSRTKFALAMQFSIFQNATTWVRNNIIDSVKIAVYTPYVIRISNTS